MKAIKYSLQDLKGDSVAGLVVFLIAIPLCLGIALAAGAPLFAGLISGIIGGILIGFISKSQTSISGPSAALTIVFATAIASLGSFEIFLMSAVIAGGIQICFGLLRLGTLANYIPSSVIKGMLAAVGIILIVKQLPHLTGFDQANSAGSSIFNYFQGDIGSGFSELLSNFHPGAALIGFLCLATMVAWDIVPFLKKSFMPGPLAVIILGTTTNYFGNFFPSLKLEGSHLVNVPVSKSVGEFFGYFVLPDFSAISNPQVWGIGLTLALVATIDTLLNIEAIDKLDKKSRNTPMNRELVAQGIGTLSAGFIGGLPVSSVVIRGSVAIQAGSRTKVTTIIHGALILVAVALFPWALNQIPLATLAAVLIYTGYKLSKPKIFIDTFKSGFNQFLPFIITVAAIIALDLLWGVIIGLVIGLIFVLRNDIRSALEVTKEKQYKEDVARLTLPQVASFINKAKMRTLLNAVPHESKIIVDASHAKYIDHDIIEVIRNFKTIMAPDKNIGLSLIGFNDKYGLPNETQHTHTMTREMQQQLSPTDVLDILKEGNQRFVKGYHIDQNIADQLNITSRDGAHPLAVVVSCADSNTHTEMVFDVGLGDIYSIRIAGNVVDKDVMASIEFACKMEGAKLIVILGHSNCRAIKGVCDNLDFGNLSALFNKMKPAVEAETITRTERNGSNPMFVKNVTRLNVHHNIFHVAENSEVLGEMIMNEEVGIIGAMYDEQRGEVKFTPMYQPSKVTG